MVTCELQEMDSLRMMRPQAFLAAPLLSLRGPGPTGSASAMIDARYRIEQRRLNDSGFQEILGFSPMRRNTRPRFRTVSGGSLLQAPVRRPANLPDGPTPTRNALCDELAFDIREGSGYVYMSVKRR